jgi:hypothetical protein
VLGYSIRAAAGSIRETMSLTVQTWSVRPAAIAGVVFTPAAVPGISLLYQVITGHYRIMSSRAKRGIFSAVIEDRMRRSVATFRPSAPYPAAPSISQDASAATCWTPPYRRSLVSNSRTADARSSVPKSGHMRSTNSSSA